MQSARSFLRWLTLVLAVTLALTPAAWAALPTIVGLSPSSVVARGAAFTLTINGANFTSASTSKLGTTALTTTYKSATQLTASVPASLIATAGTASVTVTTVSGSSAAATLTINPPPPTIASVNPTAAVAGSAQTLTINGTNFTSASTAKLGTTALTTTYKSATQLTAAVPASLIATAGRASVTVTTVSGVSPAVGLIVNPPPPTVTGLSPSSIVNGGPTFTLTIDGTNFLSGTAPIVVRWNSAPLETNYVSSTQLTATVPARLIGGPGSSKISVVTAGGASSSVTFTINPAPPVITLGINPTRVSAGFGDFSLQVWVTNVTATAIVNWGTTPLATTLVGGSQLIAKVPASLVEAAGSINITVTAAGGTSAPAIFIISSPPTISNLSPSSVAAGSNPFTLTISGANFTSNSAVYFEAVHLTTNFVSATQLTAKVPGNLLATAHVTSVWVYIPGVGSTRSSLFTVNPAPPNITSLSPSSVTADGAGFMLDIMGTAFTWDAKIKWDTTTLDTIYISPTLLRIAVPASFIEIAGTASITVTTAAGTSAPAIITIKPAPPTIGSLSPRVATAGQAAITLSVNGNNFLSSSAVFFGSTQLATTYVSAAQLTAAVPAQLISATGQASVSVYTPGVGSTGSASFSIYPGMKMTTATLPSGTAGNAYSGPINVAGGVAGYTWTVTGLPDDLTYFNTSGSTLTITGTPASPGAKTFQVSVADTAGATAGPVTYTINVADGVSGVNNGNLNGSYACLFQGFVDYDGSRWASVASIQADGQGHFTSGIFDTNSYGIGSASGTIAGSYKIGSDNNGLATLRTILTDGAAGIQTLQWALALTDASQPAQQFRMVEADDLGALPSGQQGTADCYLATTSAFRANTIDGSSFVFGLEGEDGDGTLKAAVGLFSAAAGKIVSGNLDSAKGGNPTVHTAAFTGSYTAPDPGTGRFMIHLKDMSDPAGLTVYIIDRNRMFILDNTWDNGEQAGNMRTQQQASYSGASIDGPFVLYLRGAEFNASGIVPSGYYANVFAGAGDGAGNMTINQSYTNDSGAYSAGSAKVGPIALAFDSANPGRATFQSASGITYLYLFDTGSAFEMGVKDNGSVDAGRLEAQTQTAFTDAALAGNYLAGELPLMTPEANGNVGEYNLPGDGTITGAATTTGQENLSWDQSIGMSYAWDATASGTGTFLIASSAQGGASCAVISATKFVCMPQTDPSPSIEIMQE